MNKLNLSAGELKLIVSKLKEVISKKGKVPAIENALVHVGHGKTEFIGTDLDIHIIMTLTRESEQEFSFLLPFEQFKAIAGLVLSDVTISVTDKGAVIVAHGEDEWNLGATGDAADFPKLPEPPKQKRIEAPAELIDSMATAAMSVLQDNLRPAMCCVALDIKGNMVSIVSTDSFSMFIDKLPLVAEDTTEPLLVSPKVIHAIAGMEGVQMSWTKERLAFTGNNMTVIARRLDAKFPAYHAIVPAETPKSVTLVKYQLDAALETCSVVKVVQHELLIKISEGELLMDATSQDSGMSAKTRIGATIDTPVKELCLSSRILQRSLDQMKSAGIAQDAQVNLSITDAKRAVILRVEGNEHFMVLIMPISKSNPTT